MNDKPLIALLRSIIVSGLAQQGLTASVKANNQSTPQTDEAAGNDTVYISKIMDKPRGQPKRSVAVIDSVSNQTETQIMDTTFKIEAEAIQNPTNTAQTTAADYVKAVVRVLQSNVTIATLQAAGVGIFRIQEIGTTYFENDLGGFEANPNCQVILAHTDTLVQTITSINKVSGTISSSS